MKRMQRRRLDSPQRILFAATCRLVAGGLTARADPAGMDHDTCTEAIETAWECVLTAPDFVDACARLQLLQQRWRDEERTLETVLAELQRVRDLAARELAWRRLQGAVAEPRLAQCALRLQEECDAVAIELSHVRLALAGASDELARQGSARLAC
jgi:hypothetical protein